MKSIFAVVLCLVSAVAARGVVVERNESIVYFSTNVYLFDQPTTPLHLRISNLDGYLPLTGGTMLGNLDFGTTNSIENAKSIATASISAQSYDALGGTVSNAGTVKSTNIIASSIRATGSSSYGLTFNGTDSLHYKYGSANDIFGISKFNTPVRALSLMTTNFTVRIGASLETDFVIDGSGVNMGGGLRVNTNIVVNGDGHLAFSNSAAASTSTIAVHTARGNLVVKSGGATYPLAPGNIVLSPGNNGPAQGNTIIEGRANIGSVYSPIIYLATNFPPGATSWLYSNGTNLYFATTAGFTNALTSNTP